MNRYQAPLQAPRPAPYQAHLPRGPTHAPAARPPAPTGPSLDNLPKTVPNVVETDPNPLTCPVCLDSKAQVRFISVFFCIATCGTVSFGTASFGTASFGTASFGTASFGTASFGTFINAYFPKASKLYA